MKIATKLCIIPKIPQKHKFNVLFFVVAYPFPFRIQFQCAVSWLFSVSLLYVSSLLVSSAHVYCLFQCPVEKRQNKVKFRTKYDNYRMNVDVEKRKLLTKKLNS